MASAFCVLSEMEPKLMAENISGTSSLICGGIFDITRRPHSSTLSASGRLPKSTRVSMGSRRGSMDGFVTWLAFSSR